MLKRMRWRFISSAMSAFTSVILLLFAFINLWNYTATVRQQDRNISTLYDVDQGNRQSSSAPPLPDREQPFHNAFPAYSPEMQYMLRFFLVYCDDSGKIKGTNQDFIASVSESDAASYAAKVLGSRKEHGFLNGYRYAVREEDRGKTLVFLNSERELHSMRTLLLQTGSIALSCLLAVFLLVILFSKKAIAPYVRNIETQKRFITDAGHELKTPLTSILTSADVLAGEYEENEWVRNIQKQSRRMAKLTSNLVTLSRLDEERPFPERSQFSLSETAWEVSEPFASLARARGKEYIQQIDDGVMMTGDRNAVGQALSILLDNALKYSDDRGHIRLDVRCRKHRVEISVYNTCRMPLLVDTDKIFDRFYRADASHSDEIGGTGIGLSIAKATVEAHDGTIYAARQGENGIVFSLQFRV